MIITLRNCRGLRAADIDVSALALVAGRNGAGKSSLCEAAAAALTGEMPRKLSKKDSGQLITDGHGYAAVNISRGGVGDMVSISWPAAERTTTGDAPTATAIAAGTARPLRADRRERAALLVEALHSEPDEAALRTGLQAAGVPPDARFEERGIGELILAEIAEHGWDGAWKLAGERATKMKGAWEQVTRTHYGARIAETWRPDGWEIDLEDVTEAAVQAGVAACKGARTHRVTHAAAANALENLRAELSVARKIAERLDDGRAALAAADRQLRDARAALQLLPPTAGDAGQPCPHCGAIIHVGTTAAGYRIEAGAEAVSAEERQRRNAARAVAAQAVSDAELHHKAVSRGLAKVEAAADRVPALQAEIAQREADAPAKDAAGIEHAERLLLTMEARLRMVQQRDAAVVIARRIVAFTAIAQLLAPGGLRLQRLRAAIAKLNASLERLAALASWPALALDDDLHATLGGRAQALWSASESFRADVLLQAALAGKSDMLVVDGIDILDQSGRNGLLEMLRQLAVPALVTVTMSAPAKVPDLRAAGAGRSYWIEAGVARPVGEPMVRTA